eukprot:m.235316 g.235316  ORF g.235316 m.235316 type:complete len:801 (-) comp16043_c0_seq2:93-2495(-)
MILQKLLGRHGGWMFAILLITSLVNAEGSYGDVCAATITHYRNTVDWINDCKINQTSDVIKCSCACKRDWSLDKCIEQCCGSNETTTPISSSSSSMISITKPTKPPRDHNCEDNFTAMVIKKLVNCLDLDRKLHYLNTCYCDCRRDTGKLQSCVNSCCRYYGSEFFHPFKTNSITSTTYENTVTSTTVFRVTTSTTTTPSSFTTSRLPSSSTSASRIHTTSLHSKSSSSRMKTNSVHPTSSTIQSPSVAPQEVTTTSSLLVTTSTSIAPHDSYAKKPGIAFVFKPTKTRLKSMPCNSSTLSQFADGVAKEAVTWKVPTLSFTGTCIKDYVNITVRFVDVHDAKKVFSSVEKHFNLAINDVIYHAEVSPIGFVPWDSGVNTSKNNHMILAIVVCVLIVSIVGGGGIYAVTPKTKTTKDGIVYSELRTTSSLLTISHIRLRVDNGGGAKDYNLDEVLLRKPSNGREWVLWTPDGVMKPLQMHLVLYFEDESKIASEDMPRDFNISLHKVNPRNRRNLLYESIQDSPTATLTFSGIVENPCLLEIPDPSCMRFHSMQAKSESRINAFSDKVHVLRLKSSDGISISGTIELEVFAGKKNLAFFKISNRIKRPAGKKPKPSPEPEHKVLTPQMTSTHVSSMIPPPSARQQSPPTRETAFADNNPLPQYTYGMSPDYSQASSSPIQQAGSPMGYSSEYELPLPEDILELNSMMSMNDQTRGYINQSQLETIPLPVDPPHVDMLNSNSMTQDGAFGDMVLMNFEANVTNSGIEQAIAANNANLTQPQGSDINFLEWLQNSEQGDVAF